MIERLKWRLRRKEPMPWDEREEKMKFQAKDWWKVLLSLFLLVVYLFPFYVIINVSLKPFSDAKSRMQFPKEIYWENYEKVIESGEIFNRDC